MRSSGLVAKKRSCGVTGVEVFVWKEGRILDTSTARFMANHQ